MTHDHGMKRIGVSLGGGIVSMGPVIPERRRCACPRVYCATEATQEDLLCDRCRSNCTNVSREGS